MNGWNSTIMPIKDGLPQCRTMSKATSVFPVPHGRMLKLLQPLDVAFTNNTVQIGESQHGGVPPVEQLVLSLRPEQTVSQQRASL